MLTPSPETRLRETCRLTGADWAAWLVREHETWILRAASGLRKAQRRALLAWLERPTVRQWLQRLPAGQVRLRKVETGEGLATERLFAFAHPSLAQVLLVGAPRLTAQGRALWRILLEGQDGLGREDNLEEQISRLWASAYLPDALDRLLDVFLTSLGCQAGWFSILAGEVLEVRACKHCSEGQTLPLRLKMTPFWRHLLEAGRAIVVLPGQPEWNDLPKPCCNAEARVWVGQALLIGKRPIGAVGLWLCEVPSPDFLKQVQRLAGEYAPLIENNIIFADVSHYLRRLALLNDVFVSLSAATDTATLIRRLLLLLRRAFHTERVFACLRLGESGGALRYLMRPDGRMEQVELPPSWPGEEAGQERLQRWSALAPEFSYQPLYSDSRSALLFRLLSPQQSWGVLGLESEREGAFGPYDEHFLSIIGGYLISLLENRRLQIETEARARNLGLIHAVVEQTIGLLDVQRVAQIAAELIAENFSYELTSISLVEGEDFRVVGVGGSAAGALYRALQDASFPAWAGIVGRVLATGTSLLVNDVRTDPYYLSLPGWEAGSELCVPLKDGETILGAIDVESQRLHAFTPGDVLLLESLAGILGSVIARARQYQNLQATVEALEAARLELQQRMAAQQAAETRLFQAAKLAAVGEMAAGIAHELNNPLTTVIGFTELALETPNLPPETRADLELVLQEAQRARSVVRRLLDFARQSESVRTRCDLNQIVADALALTHHLLRTGGITVHARYAEGLPWVSVDSNQIKQVVLNLVHNAMHAMPDGGHLYIETSSQVRRGREGVLVSIRDTGIGIPPENLERIFEPFFTTRSDQGGTGLGLSVSYGIVVDHGGEIDVTSQVGQGATFTIWLPVEAG